MNNQSTDAFDAALAGEDLEEDSEPEEPEEENILE